MLCVWSNRASRNAEQDSCFVAQQVKTCMQVEARAWCRIVSAGAHTDDNVSIQLLAGGFLTCRQFYAHEVLHLPNAREHEVLRRDAVGCHAWYVGLPRHLKVYGTRLFVDANVTIVLMAPQARLLCRAEFFEQVRVNIVLRAPCQRICSSNTMQPWVSRT